MGKLDMMMIPLTMLVIVMIVQTIKLFFSLRCFFFFIANGMIFNLLFFLAKHLLFLGELYLNILMVVYPIYYMFQFLFFCIIL